MAPAASQKRLSMELSVIIPVYNEEKSVGDLISAIQENLSAIDYELIIVNDCSTDDTLSNAIAKKDGRLRIISFDKNYGQSTAIKAGIDHAAGDIIAIIDGDMQNDPGELKKLYELLRKGQADMIQGYRKNRHDSLSKKVPSTAANSLIRLIFHTDLHDVGCSVKVFHRKLIPELIYFNGFHRYLALIAHIRGFKVEETVVNHYPRMSGKSKYGIERLIPVCRHLFLLKTNPDRLREAINYKIEAEY